MLKLANGQQHPYEEGSAVDFKTNDGAIHAGVVVKKFKETGQVSIFDEDDGHLFTGMETTIILVHSSYEPTTPLIDRVYVMAGAA